MCHWILHIQEIVYAWTPMGLFHSTAQMAIIHPCALPGRSLSIILQNLMHYFSYFTALNTNLTTPSTDAHLDNDLWVQACRRFCTSSWPIAGVWSKCLPYWHLLNLPTPCFLGNTQSSLIGFKNYVQMLKWVEKSSTICIWQAEIYIMVSANGSWMKKNPRTCFAKAAEL